MERHTGMCHPNGSLFSPKILRHGSHAGQKSLEEGPFHKNCQKIVKSAIFEGRKTLRNGFRFAKISKKLSNQPFFE